MPKDLDLSDLAEVRRRVVAPVLAVMYRDGEVVAVGVGPVEDRLHVTITTVDGSDDYDIGWVHTGPVDAADVAYRLADWIQEYISETSFAWGEERSMHGPIPGPVRGE